VIIAVGAVRMMEVTLDQVVDMVAVRDLLVAAARAVHVGLVVSATCVRRSARCGILGSDLDDALIYMSVVRMVQMSIMEVVDMVAVANGGVTTALTVHVLMVRVLLALHGRFSLRLAARSHPDDAYTVAELVRRSTMLDRQSNLATPRTRDSRRQSARSARLRSAYDRAGYGPGYDSTSAARAAAKAVAAAGASPRPSAKVNPAANVSPAP
jgi:hypothetical protein